MIIIKSNLLIAIMCIFTAAIFISLNNKRNSMTCRLYIASYIIVLLASHIVTYIGIKTSVSWAKRFTCLG